MRAQGGGRGGKKGAGWEGGCGVDAPASTRMHTTDWAHRVGQERRKMTPTDRRTVTQKHLACLTPCSGARQGGGAKWATDDARWKQQKGLSRGGNFVSSHPVRASPASAGTDMSQSLSRHPVGAETDLHANENPCRHPVRASPASEGTDMSQSLSRHPVGAETDLHTYSTTPCTPPPSPRLQQDCLVRDKGDQRGCDWKIRACCEKRRT